MALQKDKKYAVIDLPKSKVDAKEFVKLVDAQIQEFVGSNAERGSKRMSVMVVDEDFRGNH